jgi:4-alpha-glucanotransferase
MSDRRSGILLHPTSLPGPHGAGDLGASAHRFVAWLAQAGQRVWQLLPLAPTGYGDSPYQALSSRAGNPLLVSLEVLRNEGWLSDADLAGAAADSPDAAELHQAVSWKRSRLARATEAFRARAGSEPRADLADFRAREGGWLEDWALFTVLKDAHGGQPWTAWPVPLARREPGALEEARQRHAAAIDVAVFAQWCFFRQWEALRARCRALDVTLIGDLPIYVAHDSVEVWSRPDLFDLEASGEPRSVSGVPPDYFSATGQRWGNPIYDWDRLALDGHAFWVGRVRGTLAMVDRIRLDHFRGFEAYWRIPASCPTAVEGAWVPGPGAPLFEALERALGPLPFIAENLGVITPEVEALRRRFGFPGMAVLQFAFGNDPQAPTFRPHNYSRDLVAYTGTHDNDTAMGWWEGGAEGSVRSAADVQAEKALAREYLGTDGREMNWVMMRALSTSVADTVVFPMQDVLGLGNAARMNRPATLGGNWRWRVREEALSPALAARLARMAKVTDR